LTVKRRQDKSKQSKGDEMLDRFNQATLAESSGSTSWTDGAK